MERHLGQATFDVSLSYEDSGNENPGECCWSFTVEALRRVFARFPKLETFGMIPESIGDAVQYFAEDGEEVENFSDLDGEASIAIRDADAGIILLAAMGEIGGHWAVEWSGENNTWFFHDWDHAIHDCIITHEGPKIVGVDWETERRAQVNGARDALRNGVSIDDVCQAVVSILEQFESRFKAPIGSIWSDIFHGFKVA